MMKKEIVVIGGGPAGLISAATAKKNFPDKDVLIIKKEKVGLVPCGIPYIFSTIGSVDGDIMSTAGVEKLGVEFLVDEVVDVSFEEKKLRTKAGEEIEYEKLILAVGSTPIIPKIPGHDLEGVYTVSKYKDYLEKLLEAVKSANRILIIGGGFIGVEVSDEINKLGKNVTIVEMLENLLPNAFDDDMGGILEENMKNKGIKVFTKTKVEEILGDGKVRAVKLSSGEELETDLVIFSVGYRPNTAWLKDKGIRLMENGSIWVDEYMRTSVKDVFAVGDCAAHRSFFTRKPSGLMLASTATFDARIAGANLYGLKVIRMNKGNLAVYSTSVEGLTLGRAGLNEKMAKEEGFEYVVGKAQGLDRHPGKIPDATKITVKLLFSKASGILLGGQIAGGKSVGEMINIVALAMQMGATANDMYTMQIGTHPLLTSAPTTYPLLLAAEDAMRKM